MFIDTHCHLNDEKFGDLDDVISRMRDEGVHLAVCAGYDLPSSYRAAELAETYEEVYFTAGIHPDAEKSVSKQSLKELSALCAHKKCLAVGEIGLDYHYLPFDKEGQKRAFAAQIELAAQVNLPFCVHARDCAGELLPFLREREALLKNGFVMHCYSGSAETARELVKLGAYLSFAGPLTFKNARSLPEVAASAPLERLLTETDSPYLSPHPYRGERNEPARVRLVAEELARIRGQDDAALALAIDGNARRIFPKYKGAK